jgi:hypothetical protein
VFQSPFNICDVNGTGVPRVFMHFPRRYIPESELYQRKIKLETPAGGYGYVRFKSLLSPTQIEVECTFIPCGNILFGQLAFSRGNLM